MSFGSGLHQWGFTLCKFARMYSEKFGIGYDKMMPGRKLKILDVGGLNVNGSVRPLFDGHDFCALDMEADPSVDVVSPPGQQKRAKFPTSKAPISAVFHSFRLTFGRAIISWNGLEAWMLFPERARAERSR